MADAGVPAVTSETSPVATDEIPTNLPSECHKDYIPLANMLATGQLAEADQVCWSSGRDWCPRLAVGMHMRRQVLKFCWLLFRSLPLDD